MDEPTLEYESAKKPTRSRTSPVVAGVTTGLLLGLWPVAGFVGSSIDKAMNPDTMFAGLNGLFFGFFAAAGLTFVCFVAGVVVLATGHAATDRRLRGFAYGSVIAGGLCILLVAGCFVMVRG